MEIINKIRAKMADNENNPAVTLAFLGDSVTQGCFELIERADAGFNNCNDHQHAYHAYLKQILSVLYPGVPVNIINAGVAGKNAPHGLMRLERDVIAHKPDLTVVCFGLNDCGAGDNGIDDYLNALEQIFDKLSASGSEIIFMTPNMMATHVSPLLFSSLFQSIAKGVSEKQESGILDRYLQAAMDLCSKRNIPVCDCYSKWKMLYANGVDVTELLANKINHPTREMHWLFAASLIETMMR